MCRCPTNDKSNCTAWLPVQDVIAGIHSSMDGNRLMEMLLKSMQCSDRCCCLNSAQYLARKKKTMLNVVLHKTEIHLTFKIIKKMSTNSFCFVSNSPPYSHRHFLPVLTLQTSCCVRLQLCYVRTRVILSWAEENNGNLGVNSRGGICHCDSEVVSYWSLLLIQVLSSALIKYCIMTSITTSIKHIIKYDTVIHVAAEG